MKISDTNTKTYINNVLVESFPEVVNESGFRSEVLEQHEVLHSDALAVHEGVLHHACHRHRPQEPADNNNKYIRKIFITIKYKTETTGCRSISTG